MWTLKCGDYTLFRCHLWWLFRYQLLCTKENCPKLPPIVNLGFAMPTLAGKDFWPSTLSVHLVILHLSGCPSAAFSSGKTWLRDGRAFLLIVTWSNHDSQTCRLCSEALELQQLLMSFLSIPVFLLNTSTIQASFEHGFSIFFMNINVKQAFLALHCFEIGSLECTNLAFRFCGQPCW